MTASEPFPKWDSLPDFGLYMDQVLTFTERCFPGEVTAGMINSYVKAGIVERPQGKKYSRQSLAQLLMVCGLKPATPLDALRQLLHPEEADDDTRALYEAFRSGWAGLQESLPTQADLDALHCALLAACYQKRCRELLRKRGEEEAQRDG